ncbi:hypothetical protein GZ77_23800 [Endozoicomonas montiporae]|uniref:Calcineurin-like phosphoesterase domain-containing protein n=2 Tax=Endozoicomonas montiporae TaxID=1027273 RepID=A0A081MZD0_9GAMM|nr:hypothetical protein [Endozoicomonas montiporae]AMO54762.1 hypothetical protein EZMO1_0512 [Endozoicomonas montiporae CL-33]KEQ11553.1 hypothetical protein GZ77_23800 [Endozoicomonas montiporae]
MKLAAGHFLSGAVALILLITGGVASAESIVSCPVGMKYQGNTCYQPCKSGYEEDGLVCRQGCSSGFSWDGSACSKLYGLVSYYPDSYTRSTSVPEVCDSSSFSKALSAPGSAEPFTLVVSSDSQYPWWSRTEENTEETKRRGELTNKQQIRAMNTITNITHASGEQTVTGTWPDNNNLTDSRRGKAIPKPKGVIINGDLTAFWHDWQVEKYMDLYHRNDDDPNNQENLKLDLFPGLGNHDYANNANDCWWGRNLEYVVLGADGCAKNAAHYIKKMVSCQQVSNFPSSKVVAFDENSLAYTWAEGQYYFIQLNNYPTYSYSDIDVSASVTWLGNELNRAKAAGYRNVLLMHDYGEHMRQSNSEFISAIAGKNVVAIFAGHVHSSNGYVGSVPGYPHIPLFRSGAAEYNTFLLAEFGKDFMTIGVVSSLEGKPTFLDPRSSRKMKTIQFSSP